MKLKHIGYFLLPLTVIVFLFYYFDMTHLFKTGKSLLSNAVSVGDTGEYSLSLRRFPYVIAAFSFFFGIVSSFRLKPLSESNFNINFNKKYFKLSLELSKKPFFIINFLFIPMFVQGIFALYLPQATESVIWSEPLNSDIVVAYINGNLLKYIVIMLISVAVCLCFQKKF